MGGKDPGTWIITHCRLWSFNRKPQDFFQKHIFISKLLMWYLGNLSPVIALREKLLILNKTIICI